MKEKWAGEMQRSWASPIGYMDSLALTLAEERRLIENSQSDPEAFAPLYERYYERIYTYIYRLCINRAQAEDLTAETFMKALNSLQSYRHEGLPFQAWLYRIAYNTFISQYRKDRVRRLFRLRSSKEGNVQNLHNHHLLHEIEMDSAGETVLLLIKRLKPCDQTILTLRYFEGLNHREIARVVEMEETNVRSRMHRALGKLQNMIEKEYPQLAAWIEGEF